MYLHEDKDLFNDVLTNTADYFHLPLKIIEKDYYVTMILKLLASKRETVVFKGGTSLSKCYHAINRFSEDIDITFTEHLGEAKRKKLKNEVIKSISAELKMPISNWDKTQSDRDYNCYLFQYESLDSEENNSLLPYVKMETALGSYSFPVNFMAIDSYVYNYLIIENEEIIKEYGLEPFNMNVQSLERTFVDKVYALCDYFMQNKSERYSRHLYDLVKLRPLVTIDDEFKHLVKEVRNHRAGMGICPSALPEINIREIIHEFCDSDFYASDYEKITSYFVNAPVAYAVTKENILTLADLEIF